MEEDINLDNLTDEQIIELFNKRIKPKLDSNEYIIVGNKLQKGRHEYKPGYDADDGYMHGESTGGFVQWVPEEDRPLPDES